MAPTFFSQKKALDKNLRHKNPPGYREMTGKRPGNDREMTGLTGSFIFL